MPPRPAPPADQLVTSSDLVRHFGLWQERAARAPLYILHRGRPRFVLTSIETMDALCTPHAEAGAVAAHPVDPTALLDAMSDLVLVADEAGAILATSRAARAHFGAVAGIGTRIDAIVPPAARAALVEAFRRVRAWGVGERLELPSIAREGRMLLLTIEPAGRGVVVLARDTTEQAQSRTSATERALAAAMQTTGQVASATINLRGYIADPTPAFTALTGLDPATLAHARFVALAGAGARGPLGAALEQAIAGDAPAVLDTELLRNASDPIPVRIGLAPIRTGASVIGAVAVIVAQHIYDLV